MDRLYDVIMVRQPTDSYKRCVSTNPAKDTIDIALAKSQHRNYVSILMESGLEVIELPPLAACPDSVFAYDPALLGVNKCVVGRFGEMTRRGENNALAKDLSNYSSKVGELTFVEEPGTLEGGDILVTEDEIFVGESTRTNRDGIAQLQQHFAGVDVKLVKAKTFHLLCGCTYLNQRTMLIVPDIVDPKSFPDFKFISIPKEESYAAEALYLGERRVLIPYGYPRSAKNLRSAGYTPIETNLSEFYKGDGGVSCLSAPVFKTL